jgi:hypothetical protein
MEPLQMRKLVDGNCSVGSLGSAIFLFLAARASSCMVCGEEFAGRMRVTIGLYLRRISEGMGKDSIKRG